MSDFMTYIRPELLILIPVLYILGLIIKTTAAMNDKYIPAVLGLLGVILAIIYVIATSGLSLMCIFIAITQGILVTGAAVYANQLIKQAKK